MSLESVKARLAAASNILTTAAATAQHASTLANEARMSVAVSERKINESLAGINVMINSLNEQRAVVIAATAGHGVNTPTEGLLQIDIGLRKLEDARTKLHAALAHVQDAYRNIGNAPQDVAEASTVMNTASGIFDRYRVSF